MQCMLSLIVSGCRSNWIPSIPSTVKLLTADVTHDASSAQIIHIYFYELKRDEGVLIITEHVENIHESGLVIGRWSATCMMRWGWRAM